MELYALVVEVFSLGSGVYFSPPELYGTYICFHLTLLPKIGGITN